MDLFFADPESHPQSLGLTQVRYNIGGSDAADPDARDLRPGGFVQPSFAGSSKSHSSGEPM